MAWRYRLLRWLTRDLHRRFERAFADPATAQRERLAAILARGARSEYGRNWGFARLRGPDEYRATVPLVVYDDLAPWIERVAAGEPSVLTGQPVRLLLRTSGTTGPAKLLPCTPAFERETGDARAWWVARMVQEDERNALGKHLTVYSPEREGVTSGGLPYGSNTGRIRNRQPALVKAADPVPEAVHALEDATARYDLILLYALAAEDLGTLTAVNPSSVLALLRRLDAVGPDLIEELRLGTPARRAGVDTALHAELTRRLDAQPERAARLGSLLSEGRPLQVASVWPQLTTVNTWRCGGAAFYEPTLRARLGDIPLRDPGFSASEGFVAIPWTHTRSEGVLNVGGHFFEFLPADAPAGGGGQATCLAHELTPGQQVRPVLTTSGGLYRYDLGDIAEVVGRYGATPTLRFLRRAGRVLSLTGEKVTEHHAATAARRACERVGLRAAGSTVGLRLGELPAYCLAVEALDDAPLPAGLAEAFDDELGRANVEYRSKRGSLRLGPAVVIPLPSGAYERLEGELVASGAPAAQVKAPALAMDYEIIERLARADGRRSASGRGTEPALP